ncbi:MAG: DUF1801 domain-containing protein [Planctomycetota bacterium]
MSKKKSKARKDARKKVAPASAAARSAVRAGETSAARRIDARIRELAGWRGETLARVRALILAAAPEICEEWKWNNPVWSHGGIVCTGEAYAKVVKLTFARGAELADPAGLFNASLNGNTRRAIDLREGEELDAGAFQALVRAAVAGNGARKKKEKPAKPVKLLSGGNPQIAKGDGDAPVQAYLDALPGWKRDVGRKLDALLVKSVPGVKKAVKWNSPFYGVEGQGWFLGVHAFTRYLKVTFFRGAALRPVPPGGTEKSKDARWIDLHEGDTLDEKQLGAWLKQAAALPGWMS